MSGEFRESAHEPSQGLATIEHHFATPLDPNVVEFSHLLSGRLNSELVPMEFVMASSLLVYDLQKGVNGFTSKPIDSPLVQQSNELYRELQDRLPALAEFSFSPQFAAEVGQFVDKVLGRPADSSGQTVEETLTLPIKAERTLVPGTLPETGKVELVRVLENGIKLFVDQEVILLGNEFDPSSYGGPMGSAYGDYSLEMLIDPIVGLGQANGQYFGLEKDGLDKLINFNSGLFVGYDINSLPDLRKLDVNGKTVYFPTARLLENMGVIRRGVDAPEAANAGILAFLLKNGPLGDETPAKEEALPEIELPGLDPFDIVRVNGELPE